MKTFIGNAPWRKGGKLGVRAGSRWAHTTNESEECRIPSYVPFPFFLAYAAAVLEENDKPVELVDAIAEGYDKTEFMDKIGKAKSDLVLLETSTPSIYNDLEYAKTMKGTFDVDVALCGSHSSIFHKEILKEGFVDYVLIDEYEYTLLDLVKQLESGNDLKSVSGLAYVSNGEVKLNEKRELCDINRLPWPARHFLPMDNYNNDFARLPTPTGQMIATRGCPHNCIYCTSKVIYGGRSYRTRDPTDVVEEMKWLIDKYGFKSIFFDDDVFNIGKERTLEIGRLIKENGIDVPWAIMVRADASDGETLKALRGAGLYAIAAGVESGVQEMVNGAKKNLNLERVKDTVGIAKKLGIKTHLTFTFGLPNENWNTIKQTLRFISTVSPDSVQFSITTPFPGTEYFDWADNNGFLLTKDWSKYDGSVGTVIRTKDMDVHELEKALETAKSWWNRYQIKQTLIHDPLGSVVRGIKNPQASINAIRTGISWLTKRDDINF